MYALIPLFSLFILISHVDCTNAPDNELIFVDFNRKKKQKLAKCALTSFEQEKKDWFSLKFKLRNLKAIKKKYQYNIQM